MVNTSEATKELVGIMDVLLQVVTQYILVIDVLSKKVVLEYDTDHTGICRDASGAYPNW